MKNLFVLVSMAMGVAGWASCPVGQSVCKVAGDRCYGDFSYCATSEQCKKAKCLAQCPCTGRDLDGNPTYDPSCVAKCVGPAYP